MSFAATLVLKDAAAVNQNFLRLTGDTTKVNYMFQGSTNSEPVLMIIGNQMTSAQDGSDRYMIKLTRTVMDSNSKPRTLVLNCTLAVPRLGIARTHINDAIANLKEFLATANVDALLRGEL